MRARALTVGLVLKSSILITVTSHKSLIREGRAAIRTGRARFCPSGPDIRPHCVTTLRLGAAVSRTRTFVRGLLLHRDSVDFKDI